MIIQPKIRGFICTTAHPVGCAAHVQEQIDYVAKSGLIPSGPKRVLIIGSSTGYGLASRIVAGFGCGSSTIGVSFEKEAEGPKTATAGWYNTAGYEKKALAVGLYSKSFNGDAFSDEIKQRVIETIRRDWGQVDLIIYSLASPRRQHPRTGQLSKSVLRPIGGSYSNKSINMEKDLMEVVSLPPATPDEVQQTIDVMGGEDWAFWIESLEQAGLIAPKAMTVAYSYVGPELTKSIYRNGTIGRAKEHLEKTAKILDERFKKIGGRALVSVNKALVTQSSSAIPFIPLYFIILSKIMSSKNIEEHCIEQIYRLFKTRLYTGDNISVDEHGLVRLDDLEMKVDVQKDVEDIWKKIDASNVHELADLSGYHSDFLKLFGFGLLGIDYSVDVDPDVRIPSIP